MISAPSDLRQVLAKRILVRRKLREFVKEAWHVVEPATTFKPNWHIDAIADHLQAVSQGKIKRLIINIPPRCAKSTIVAVMWPCWDWIDNPGRKWLFSSYASNLSIRDSVKCRHLLASPWYRGRWGNRFALSDDQNQKMRFDNSSQGYRLATSVGGANTGEGGSIIVIDDAHNANDMSDQIRGSTLEWWDQTMSTRLNDPKTGAFVIIMQRLHERDLVGHILAKEHGWDHLCLPMEYEIQHPTPIVSSLGFVDPRKTEGELLWPNRFGPDEVATLKSRLSRGAAGQLQQRPAPAGGDIFKREWFSKNYYTMNGETPVLGGTTFPVGRRFATVDLAVSQKTTADFTVIASWMYSLGKLFLLDIDRRRIEGPDLVPAMRAAMVRNKLSEIYVEKVGFQATIIQQAQREGLPVRELIPDKDKVTRAYAATPWFEQGKVCFRSGASYLSDLEHELLGFPNAAHDDQVDTVSYACAVAFKGNSIPVGFGSSQTNRTVSNALSGIIPK